ncbi:hypothetical protein, partial [Afipia sp. NBIMC_P1-C3]|uniref:hypothetical protein n=1 Tax=Afipia sp. NBIMC_P1-C3 TaxID=1320554 RepID=UPI0019553E93
VRLAALHAPHIEGANEAGLVRAVRGTTKSSPRAMRGRNARARAEFQSGCLKIESENRDHRHKAGDDICECRAR